MKCADARAGDSGQLDGAKFRAINRAARAVSGEDSRVAGFDDLLEAKQAFARAARAGAADGFVSEELKRAGDKLAVEALADDDGCACSAEVESAGKDTLVPEAEDFGGGSGAEGKRCCSLFGDGFKAPGAADDRKHRPDEAGNDGQGDALPKGELLAGGGGHWVDFTVTGRTGGASGRDLV